MFLVGDRQLLIKLQPFDLRKLESLLDLVVVVVVEEEEEEEEEVFLRSSSELSELGVFFCKSQMKKTTFCSSTNRLRSSGSHNS